MPEMTAEVRDGLSAIQAAVRRAREPGGQLDPVSNIAFDVSTQIAEWQSRARGPDGSRTHCRLCGAVLTGPTYDLATEGELASR